MIVIHLKLYSRNERFETINAELERSMSCVTYEIANLATSSDATCRRKSTVQ